MKAAVRMKQPSSVQQDLVIRRVTNELAIFGQWLNRNNVRGVISEIGWPNNAYPQLWNNVAKAWYREANKWHLPVLAFTAQGPGTNVAQLTMYSRSNGSVSGGQSIDKANQQAKVSEAFQTTPEYWRGIDIFGGAANDGGGDGNPSIMNNVQQNTWWYETPGTYTYLASRGYKVARIGFRWERLQPTLGAALDTTEVNRLQNTISNAQNAGMQVVLDLHNYSRYVTPSGVTILGTAQLPISAFIDVWSRIATTFQSNTGVLAYSLMNEPHDMPRTPLGEPSAKHWEAAAQSAVNTIRQAGDTHEIHVSVYEWGRAQNTPLHHATAWIVDPASNIRYEAHHYLYLHHATAINYPDSFQTELQDASGIWTQEMTPGKQWANYANLTWNQLIGA